MRKSQNIGNAFVQSTGQVLRIFEKLDFYTIAEFLTKVCPYKPYSQWMDIRANYGTSVCQVGKVNDLSVARYSHLEGYIAEILS